MDELGVGMNGEFGKIPFSIVILKNVDCNGFPAQNSSQVERVLQEYRRKQRDKILIITKRSPLLMGIIN